MDRFRIIQCIRLGLLLTWVLAWLILALVSRRRRRKEKARADAPMDRRLQAAGAVLSEGETGLAALSQDMADFLLGTRFPGRLLAGGTLLGRRRRELCREQLRILDPFSPAASLERMHQIRKLGNFLLFAGAAGVLALLIELRSLAGPEEIRTLMRPDYGEDASVVHLTAYDPAGKLGEVALTVRRRQYSEAEFEALSAQWFAGALEALDAQCGETGTTEERLELPPLPEGAGITLDILSDRPGLVGADLRIHREEMQPEESWAIVDLRATLRHDARSATAHLTARISPEHAAASEEDAAGESPEGALADLLVRQEETDLSEAQVQLPKEWQDRAITWRQQDKPWGILLFAGLLAAGVAAALSEDSQLQKRVEKRADAMMRSYPRIVRRLTLYVGAGISLRGSFERIAHQYAEELSAGAEAEPAMEEIRVMLREMENGVPEGDALSHFSERCGLLAYTRFAGMLLQFLRQGNRELLVMLRRESGEAMKERSARARRLSEQAGTKLLLPMMLLLVVTMVMIMLPAYQGIL